MGSVLLIFLAAAGWARAERPNIIYILAETTDVAADFPEVAERLLKLMEGARTVPEGEDVLYDIPKKKKKG